MRVEQLAQTVRAGGRIRRNSGADAPQNLAGDNPEARLARRRNLTDFNRIDPRQGRRFRAQPYEKCIHPALCTLNFNRHTVRIVADKANQALLKSQPVDKRPETHPLHHAAHQHPAPQNPVAAFSFRLDFLSQNRASCRRQEYACP